MKTRLFHAFFLTAIALTTSGCATSFTGSAHVENGRSGCDAKCKGQGMECVGMVYMGEYSDACICTVPGQTASLERHHIAAAGGAVAAGSAGVMMVMQEQQRRQASSSH